MLKMLEAVDLNEEQSTRFIPLFHAFRKDIKALHQERKEIIDGIKQLIHDKASDDLIKKELKRIRDNHVGLNTRMLKFFDDCESILTIPQLARLMIFHERFERDMLKSVREFRRQHGSGLGIDKP
jgi:hypothetical protein